MYHTDNRVAAPEIALKGPVGQPADIWSLGCVFSELLTWTILGPVGVQEFQRIRAALMHEYTSKTNHYTMRAALGEIHTWHRLLLQVTRGVDDLSRPIAKLIENDMLIEKPEFRIDADGLYFELNEILQSFRPRPPGPPNPFEDSVRIALDNSFQETFMTADMPVSRLLSDNRSLLQGVEKPVMSFQAPDTSKKSLLSALRSDGVLRDKRPALGMSRPSSTASSDYYQTAIAAKVVSEDERPRRSSIRTFFKRSDSSQAPRDSVIDRYYRSRNIVSFHTF